MRFVWTEHSAELQSTSREAKVMSLSRILAAYAVESLRRLAHDELTLMFCLHNPLAAKLTRLRASLAMEEVTSCSSPGRDLRSKGRFMFSILLNPIIRHTNN